VHPRLASLIIALCFVLPAITSQVWTYAAQGWKGAARQGFSQALTQAWYDPAWQYRKMIVIDHAQVAATLVNFPVFFQVTLESGARPDGQDIVFTDAAGSVLPHEVERYDETTGELVAWVAIPALSSTADTLLYLYYGNPAATGQTGSPSVWDANYVMVQHLAEISGDHADSTLHGNDGTPSVTTQGSAPGRISGADAFDGVDDYVVCGADGSLDITGSMTVEAWALSTGSNGQNRILAKDRTGVPGKFLLWGPSGNLAFQVTDVALNWYRAQGPSIPSGEWIYAVGVYDADTRQVRLYENGVGVALVNGPLSMASNLSTALTIGASEDNQQHWAGIIDEVRISNVARSPEWISTSHENIAHPGSFYVVGTEEPQGINTPPLLTGAWPPDGSIIAPTSLTELRFTVFDSQDDLVDYTVTMTPDVIGGQQAGAAVPSGTTLAIPITAAPIEYDTAYTWAVDVTDPGGAGLVTHQTYGFRTEPQPAPPPAFVWWSISDPHIQTDLPGYRSLESAILDSANGGDQGGESFTWDIATVAGDWTGVACPTDSDGQDLIDQWNGAGADPNRFYGVIGNHDANTSDNAWFEKWVDPLGQHTGFSGIDNGRRPYPVQGAWDHYSFQVGNILFLMLGDRNEGPPPFGRLCSAGYPSGRMSLDTYNWWVQQVDQHPDLIIVTISHQALWETTAYTGFDEGYLQGIHGGHSWADRRGSSMIYTIDDWTIDGLDENENYIGARDFGFVKYLQDHPGAIDLWIHGHTHHYMYPGKSYNGRSDVEKKYGVTFINTGALTKNHGGPMAPYSRLFSFYANSSTALMQTYMHSNAWSGAPEGFYAPAEVVVQLSRAFDPRYPCGDLDGDGFCAAEDCDNLDATIFPNAPELNDGLDNQCPGDPGFGMIDEITGVTGFLNAGDSSVYSWPAQSGATAYEVARSTTSDFSASCEVFSVIGTTWSDPSLPSEGEVFYYWSRAVAPHSGDWGRDSSGLPRVVGCPAPL
jgi:hypothetical protein